MSDSRSFSSVKGLLFIQNRTLTLRRTRTRPLWQQDSGERIEEGDVDQGVAQRFLSFLPEVSHFLRRAAWSLSPVDPRIFGHLGSIMFGHGVEECDAFCRLMPISRMGRPLEWQIYPAVLLVSSADRVSVILLTSRECEVLMCNHPLLFGIYRMPQDEIYSPCHCFAEIHDAPEVVGQFVSLQAPFSPFQKGPDHVVSVEEMTMELKRLRCCHFEHNVFGSEYVPVLQQLHLVILLCGLPGLVVLKRAHMLRRKNDLFQFYFRFSWAIRSERLRRFLLRDSELRTQVDVLIGIQAVLYSLNDWVRSFGTSIARSVKQTSDASLGCFDYDGLIPGRHFDLSFQDLVRELGEAKDAIGLVNVTHAHVRDGITVQFEEPAEEVPFSQICNFLEKITVERRCDENCSVQVRWALSKAESESGHGAAFCSTLSRTGLYILDGSKQELLQSSVGWMEGFTSPYFMCRRAGQFVGHTEQGGTGAVGCILNQESPAMKWESMYIPFGPILAAFRQLQADLAVVNGGNEKEPGSYPGPLLWSDDEQGQLVLEAHGIVFFYGNLCIQHPGDFAMTACSRLIEDKGLYVEYHQTRTVNDDRKLWREPMVLFSQNAAPLENSTWSSDVVQLLTRGEENPCDTVLRCWGLGFLAFLESHPGVVVPSMALIRAARSAAMDEIVVSALKNIVNLPLNGFASVLRKPFFTSLKDLVFPFDLYNNAKHRGGQLFHQICCEECGVVVPSLCFIEQRKKGKKGKHVEEVISCITCRGRCNAYVWKMDAVIALLKQPYGDEVDESEGLQGGSDGAGIYPILSREEDLVSTFGEHVGTLIASTLTSPAFRELHRILRQLFTVRNGVLVSLVSLRAGISIPMSHAIVLDNDIDASFDSLFTDRVPEVAVFDGRVLFFGLAYFGRRANRLALSNCYLALIGPSVELIVRSRIEPGTEIIFFQAEQNPPERAPKKRK